uniref:Uncharacterized protein n=1 Tax=Parascaris equorum TaxID=6256 RepID=A0A914REA9_PAREQ
MEEGLLNLLHVLVEFIEFRSEAVVVVLRASRAHAHLDVALFSDSNESILQRRSPRSVELSLERLCERDNSEVDFVLESSASGKMVAERLV